MKCLLVIAHPRSGSLNATLAEAAAKALRDNGHEVVVRDLYGQGFAPALTASDLTFFQAFETPQDVSGEIAELLAAEILVLVFPTWWFAMPAMLKGWFDRVWAPGVAFDPLDNGALRPRLTGLRACVAITTLGSPWWVDRLVLRRPVRAVLKNAILAVCAPQARLSFLSFYKSEKLAPEQVDAMRQRVATALRHV